MYYLILTIILWRNDSFIADAAPTMQTIEFQSEAACTKAAEKWKAGVMASHPNRSNRNQGIYALSAECVAKGSSDKSR